MGYSIQPQITKYLIYRAELDQHGGTGSPIAVEYENTIGTVTWTRTSTGVYLCTSTGNFTIGRTFTTIDGSTGRSTIQEMPMTKKFLTTEDGNTCGLTTGDASGTFADGLLWRHQVTILVLL